MENQGVLCCYESKVSNFKFPEDPELPDEWLKKKKDFITVSNKNLAEGISHC